MRQNFFRTLFVCAFLAWFFALAGPVSASEIIWHNHEYHVTSSTIWRTGEIHAIPDYNYLIVDPGQTLTIEPGVILKVGLNSQIRIHGNLEAVGTPESMIRVVSLRDDSVGGDTNGDGSVTVPNNNDWRGIQADGSRYNSVVNFRLSYVEVKHGGRGLPRGSILSLYKVNSAIIEHSGIVDNQGVIFIDAYSKNVSIIDSNIYNPNFCNYASSTDPCHWNNGLTSFSSQTINLSGNYWGSPAGPTYSTGTDPVEFFGVVLANIRGAQMNYEPFAVEPYNFGQQKRHPVIIIPGILGSWPDMEGKKLILDPILHTYDDLWLALIQAGYEAGSSLFAFPYEWRNSNVLTAKLLQQKIEAVKAACVPSEIMDCSKVDLVAHSMGGLVARQYISQADYGNDVDQLIFIAVPHKGAPKAYAMWEGGYIGSKIRDRALWTILSIEANKKTGVYGDIGLVNYLQNYGIESVRELLPIYHYLYDDDLGQVRYYPNNYPVNPFLQNLNSTENLAQLSSSVRRITNIIGNSGNTTITGYNVVVTTEPSPLWSDGMPQDFYGSKSGILMGNGDDTVPAISNNNFLGLTPVTINQNHGPIVSYAQSEVIEELTGSVPPSEIHSNSSPSYLMISLRCPADIQIIAPDGQRLGRDELTSSTLAEISGGYYHYSDDSLLPEYAIIPNPLSGEYQVKVVGTANGGAYSVDVGYFNETTTTSGTYSGVILPGQEQSLIIDAREATSTGLIVAADITIDSAIADVNELFDRGLLTDKNSKKKLIHQYEEAKRKVEALDRLIALADGIRLKDERHGKFDRFRKVIHHYINRNMEKLLEKRQKEIDDAMREIDREVTKLLAKGKLSQLGYDIIKSNNDYLINNW